MARIIVLDAAPLGLATKQRGKPDGDRCRAWIRALDAAGARIVVPEVADYEIRRELIRVSATAGIVRLNLFVSGAEYDPITTRVMHRAAELWAHVRRAGLPTAAPQSLDADCIVAAHASLLEGPGDSVTVATVNVGHLARFPGINARDWDSIQG